MDRRKVNLIYGTTGSGKTTLANALLRPDPKVIILDCDFREIEYAAEAPNLIEFGNYVKENFNRNYRLIYTPEDWEFDDTFDIIKIAGEYSANPVMLVLEEADRFFDSRPFRSIINRGRHYNLNLTAISLRPAATITSLRSIATDVYASKFEDINDLKFFSSYFDISIFSRLGEYQFVHWKKYDSRNLSIVDSYLRLYK